MRLLQSAATPPLPLFTSDYCAKAGMKMSLQTKANSCICSGGRRPKIEICMYYSNG